MAVRQVLLYPDPVLKSLSKPVKQDQPELQEAIKDLSDTLEASPGCVGIAAPQIGILLRIVLIDLSRSRKAIANQGRILLINPEIETREGAVLGREGCLSLPHLTANVTRAQRIKLSYQNQEFSNLHLEAADFEARVIQHEMDHLDGLLFLDRVSCLKTDVFRRKRY